MSRTIVKINTRSLYPQINVDMDIDYFRTFMNSPPPKDLIQSLDKELFKFSLLHMSDFELKLKFACYDALAEIKRLTAQQIYEHDGLRLESSRRARVGVQAKLKLVNAPHECKGLSDEQVEELHNQTFEHEVEDYAINNSMVVPSHNVVPYENVHNNVVANSTANNNSWNQGQLLDSDQFLQTDLGYERVRRVKTLKIKFSPFSE
jgi:hypothetical protein